MIFCARAILKAGHARSAALLADVDTHQDRYCVYVNLHKDQTLVANWRENGLNYYGPAQGRDHQLVDSLYKGATTFPAKPLTLGWNGALCLGSTRLSSLQRLNCALIVGCVWRLLLCCGDRTVYF